MKKHFLSHLLGLFALLWLNSGLVAHALLYSGEETLSIKTGTSLGHCGGYCTQDFVITRDKIIYTQIANPVGGANYPKGFQPIIKQEIPISNEKWTDLLRINDMKSFESLPARISCPDCDDSGAEWIEVNKLDHTDPITLKRFYRSKKVSFPYNQSLPANNDFAMKVRALRTEIMKQYGGKK